MKKQVLMVGAIGSIVALFAVPAIIHSLSQSAAAECPIRTSLPSAPGTYKVQAAKVGVAPWQGEHNVMGIFVLPDEYKPGRMALLQLEGTDFSLSERVDYRGTRKSRVQAPPGHYITKIYIPTRQAIGLIVRGNFDKLKQPCNWILTYSK